MTSISLDEQPILDDLCESNLQQIIKTPDGKSLDILLSNNTDAQKAEFRNIYFQSVFTQNANIGKAERQDNVLLNSINFIIDEIEDALNELHVNKANGPDMVGNTLLKNLSKSLPKSLHLLFNLIANKAIFPTKWKISKIAPIFKDGDKQDVSNYRPISLLSAVSKLLEKLIFS